MSDHIPAAVVPPAEGGGVAGGSTGPIGLVVAATDPDARDAQLRVAAKAARARIVERTRQLAETSFADRHADELQYQQMLQRNNRRNWDLLWSHPIFWLENQWPFLLRRLVFFLLFVVAVYYNNADLVVAA